MTFSKTKLCAGLSALSVSLALSGQVSADDAKLLDILRENGTITQQQYERLKAKYEKQEATERSTIQALKEKNEAAATNDYADSFWSKIEPFADFRFRYDYQHFNASPAIGGDAPDRNRVRIRARFGFLYNVNDNTVIGFGLASGGEDPISANQTLTDTFSRKPIDLDLAYAQHTFFDERLTALLGKFTIPYFKASPLIFDDDLRFEGVALRAEAPFNDSTSVFVNGGGYVLDELDGAGDAYMLGGQAGAEVGNDDVAKVTGAVGYYNFEDTSKIDETAFTSNTENKFDGVINPNASVEFYNLGGLYAKLYGDYVNNTSADTDGTGWLAGALFGKEEIENLLDWQIGGTYRRLEANASFDEFPESDFRSGGTNVKGWTAGYEVGLGKGFSQRTTFFYASQINGPLNGERRVQIDLLYKF